MWLDLSGARAEEAGRRVCLPRLRSFASVRRPGTNQPIRSLAQLPKVRMDVSSVALSLPREVFVGAASQL